MEEKDYKKLYEDVVALAKDGLKDGLYLSQSAKAVTEFLFPQLKETKDEKVRRELKTFLINFNNGYYSKPSENEIDSWIKWIDKKCEQKPTDKVEPKFKVGDWIVYNRDDSSREIIQVYDIRDGRYYFTDNIHFSWSVKECDEKSHLWSIQDANDGDVLATKKGNPFIYDKNRYNNGLAYYYAGLGVNKELTLKSPHHMLDHFGELSSVSPATKEQRDLLLQKMYESGYEWDSEKKKIKKIEQESTWCEEDEKFLNYAISLTDDAQIKNFLKSLKDRVQPQTKQEWSKEDSERLLRIHQFIWANRKGDTDEIYQQEQDADWLMTLTPRPKQEWNKEDETG